MNDADTAIVTEGDLQVALKAVLNVLARWGCTDSETETLLGVGAGMLANYADSPETASVSSELAERMSHILAIHETLSTLFSNKNNIDGFIRLKNHNGIFAGESPMEFMLRTGRLADLCAVRVHVEALIER